MEYLGITLGALLSTLFVVFVILSLGYALGAIKIKGISLGSAGVLLVAIIVGVIFFLCGEKDVNNKLVEFSFTLGGKKITLWGSSAQSILKTVQNIGTMLFVTSVGLIAGPKFFRSFNKSMISYVVMGAAIVLTGVVITVVLAWIDPNMSIAMGTGLLSGSLTSTPAFGAAEEAAGELASEVTAGYGIGYFLWQSPSGEYTALANFFFDHVFSVESFDKVSELYNRYNFWIIFTAGFTPLPYKLFTITGGLFHIDIAMFIIASIVSRGLRFFLFAALIWKFGGPIKTFIDKYFNILAILFTVILIGSFILVGKLV